MLFITFLTTSVLLFSYTEESRNKKWNWTGNSDYWYTPANIKKNKDFNFLVHSKHTTSPRCHGSQKPINQTDYFFCVYIYIFYKVLKSCKRVFPNSNQCKYILKDKQMCHSVYPFVWYDFFLIHCVTFGLLSYFSKTVPLAFWHLQQMLMPYKLNFHNNLVHYPKFKVYYKCI